MKRHLKILTGVAVLMAVVVVVPVAQAAPLLSRVNQAMRSAGISVTRVNQIGWGEGVVIGHYKNYQQLVDAMKWHKQQGRMIPDSSKFAKGAAAAVASVTGQTKCRTGNVLSLSKSQVTITKAGGNVRIKLTSKQYDTAVGRSI